MAKSVKEKEKEYLEKKGSVDGGYVSEKMDIEKAYDIAMEKGYDVLMQNNVLSFKLGSYKEFEDVKALIESKLGSIRFSIGCTYK